MAKISYRRHRFPPVIIQHAVWLYLRFTLSYRDVEELLPERGLDVSYETVRCWVLKFGPMIARWLRQHRLGRAIAGIWTRVRRERTTSNGSAELHRR
jgi:putative transposase